jgi:hypothetical protein
MFSKGTKKAGSDPHGQRLITRAGEIIIMPQRKAKEMNECCHHDGKMKVLIGLLMILAGFLLWIGYSWDVVLIVVGVVLLVKGLFMHKC